MKKKEHVSFSHFEKNIEELKKIVSAMEQEEVEIEHCLKLFEKGIALVRVCQTSLKQAEQKVSILMEQEGESVLQVYEKDQNALADS